MDLEEFRAQFEPLEDPVARAEGLLAFAEEAMQTCPDELGVWLTAVRDERRGANAPETAARCDRLLGWLALDKGDYATALSLFEASEETFVAGGQLLGRLQALNGLGSVHLALGNYEAALTVFRRALTLAEAGNERSQQPIIRANLGEALLALNHHPEAEEYLRHALVHATLTPLNRCLLQTQIARACLPQGKRADAEASLAEAVALARAGSFQSALALALDLRGMAELSQGRLGQAEATLAESLQVAEAAGDPSATVRARIDLGWLELQRSRSDEALNLFAAAANLAGGLGARPLESEAWQGLARAHRDRQEWREAFEAQERHHALRAELHDENTGRLVAQIRADQTRQEAELYREQSRLLAELGNLGQQITASLDLEQVFTTVYGAIGRLMEADTFGLGLVDPEGQNLHYGLVIEHGERLAPAVAPTDALTFSGWCLANRQPLLIHDVDEDYRRYVPTMPPRFGTSGKRSRSCLFVPLLAQGKAIGVLSAQSYRPGAYDQRALETLRTLAGSISIAVENARLFAELSRIATLDSLTGALNRRHLMERMAGELQRSRREGTPVSLVMVDLDHFKRLNDTRGHLAGDRALIAFAQLCQAHKRPHDLFGRFGGEEFVLVLSGTGLAGARKQAQRLCAAVAALSVALPEGEPVKFTASFGVTEIGPDDPEITQALRRADEALYEAKQRGRNRVVVAGEAGLTDRAEA